MSLRFPLSNTMFGLLLVACSTTTTNQVDPASDDQQSGAAGAGTLPTGDNLAGGKNGAGAGGTTTDGSANASAGALSEGEFGGGGAASTTTVATKELSCSTYCSLVQSNCLSENVKQYKSMESCVSSCAAFLLGSINDTGGNTLGCRAHYALLSVSDPTLCAAAGPSGGGRCGNNCDAYCALMERVCSTVFDDATACRGDCVKMAGVDEITYRYNGSGDNLQCRIYHTTFGAEGFPEIHCPHASPVPQGPCS
ncbi:MAG TPA: hypothetical protein VIV60_16695 [Polyangiaceae bacterium]